MLSVATGKWWLRYSTIAAGNTIGESCARTSMRGPLTHAPLRDQLREQDVGKPLL